MICKVLLNVWLVILRRNINESGVSGAIDNFDQEFLVKNGGNHNNPKNASSTMANTTTAQHESSTATAQEFRQKNSNGMLQEFLQEANLHNSASKKKGASGMKKNST